MLKDMGHSDEEVLTVVYRIPETCPTPMERVDIRKPYVETVKPVAPAP